MEIKELKNQKNTVEVEISITESEVEEHRDHVVEEMITTVTVKGFRQGKAPKKIALQHLDPNKLTEHLVNHLLSHAVQETLQKFKYRLIGRPVLEKMDTKDQKNWVFNINFPLFPDVKLPDYQKLLKSPKSKKTDEKNSDTKTEKIYDILLKNTNIDIPQSVIDEEVSYSLRRLENQAKSLNLSLEKYLEAAQKSIEEIKKDYAKGAEESLKLDLILTEIAKKENITTPQTEVIEMAKLSQLPDSQYHQVESIINRRKTIEFLSHI